jgi:hypothetical protein
MEGDGYDKGSVWRGNKPHDPCPPKVTEAANGRKESCGVPCRGSSSTKRSSHNSSQVTSCNWNSPPPQVPVAGSFYLFVLVTFSSFETSNREATQ